MRTSRAVAKEIISTCANALYEAVAADNSVDAVSEQLEAVVRVVRSSAPLRDVLLNEGVEGAKRADVARQVFAGLHPALVDTLAIMVERNNFDLLVSVVDAFGEIAEERRGAVAVDVTTAVELTESLRQAITAKLSADLGKGIVLREKVDPAIIGGIVISAHGRRVDASISSQLEAARVVLSTAQTGGEA
jgi:F-type H+-transporting ATPase subunit delta